MIANMHTCQITSNPPPLWEARQWATACAEVVLKPNYFFEVQHGVADPAMGLAASVFSSPLEVEAGAVVVYIRSVLLSLSLIQDDSLQYLEIHSSKQGDVRKGLSSIVLQTVSFSFLH